MPPCVTNRPPGTTSTARPIAVLVVDDDRDTADSTAAVLDAYGYPARVAYSGSAALAAAAADPPDVVLLDLAMPGMAGWELARRLRDLTPGRHPLLVTVTGYGAEGERRASVAAGVARHFVKPVEPAVLVDVLRRCARTTPGVIEVTDPGGGPVPAGDDAPGFSPAPGLSTSAGRPPSPSSRACGHGP